MTFRLVCSAALLVASLVLAGADLADAGQWVPPTPVITSPDAGASVSSPVTVTFGLQKAGSDAVKAGNHPKMHALLVIDSPPPAPGSSVQADAEHVAFPAGQLQLSVPLTAGKHQLQVVIINKAGLVAKRVPPSAAVSISVQ